MTRPLAWWLALVAAVAAAYFLLPLSTLSLDLLYAGWTFTCAVTVAVVAARRRGRAAQWWLLALGLLLAGLGDATWLVYEFASIRMPYPSVADVFYLASYPAIAVAAAVLVRRSAPGERGSVVDSAIVAVGAGALAWTVVMAPKVERVNDPLRLFVGLSYPIADILLLGVLARLLFLPRGTPPTARLLSIGVLAWLVGDAAYAVPTVARAYQTGDVLDLCWLLGYGLLAAAALRVPRREPIDAVRRAGTLPVVRLVLLTAASLLAPGVLVVEGIRGNSPDVVVLGCLSAGLFALVVLRMAGLMRRVDAQTFELERLSATDALTGLANRRAWDRRIELEVRRAQQDGGRLAVAMLDLDRFKNFNDTRGHQAGDAQLQATAQAWLTVLRPGDVLARYGGEEFALLLLDTDTVRVGQVLDRLSAAVPHGETVSAGFAVLAPGEASADVVARADEALYSAKAAGRARWCAAPPPEGSLVAGETARPGALLELDR